MVMSIHFIIIFNALNLKNYMAIILSKFLFPFYIYQDLKLKKL